MKILWHLFYLSEIKQHIYHQHDEHSTSRATNNSNNIENFVVFLHTTWPIRNIATCPTIDYWWGLQHCLYINELRSLWLNMQRYSSSLVEKWQKFLLMFGLELIYLHSSWLNNILQIPMILEITFNYFVKESILID